MTDHPTRTQQHPIGVEPDPADSLGYTPWLIPGHDTLGNRWLDPTSVRFGGTYPGEYGYIGRHRAHKIYRRGNEDQVATSRHEYDAEEWERELLGRVTIDDLLHRHCGWPFATLGESATAGIVAGLYMRRLVEDGYVRAAK